MRLVSYTYNERDRIGIVTQGLVIELDGVENLDSIFDLFPELARRAADLTRNHASSVEMGVPLSEVKLQAPVVGGAKIVGVSRNFRDFLAQAGLPVPGQPVLFAKFPNTVVGPEDCVRLPRISTKVSYEAELGVVIGKECRDVPVEEAMSCVFGYTVVNDITAVDILKQDGNLLRSKNFDSFLPVGPWIITSDEIEDSSDLKITLTINGERLQNGSTRDMVFGLPLLIHHITQDITLRPGDLVATGTPGGTAAFHDPPAYLKEGDIVAAEVQGVGRLSNIVVGSQMGRT